jgi:hypothetical protein
MLASKPPSFWNLGDPPTGGYFSESFTKIYNEYRQFRKVFGKNTGLTFKRLITEELAPTVRQDLKLTRKQYKRLDSKKLVSMLKRRLGFNQKDAYIAELEACPRLPSGLKDINAINVHFKKLSGRMLDVLERARSHGVRLRPQSCKYVLQQAVKNSYRVSQWFHMHRFHSIGDSIRRINTKLRDRMASDAEKKHDQVADQAMLNGMAGARQQLGSGTVEGSNAPERPRKGNIKKPSGLKGGIDKNSVDLAKQAKYAKEMDAHYKVENQLPNGRYYHKPTPFCQPDSTGNCSMKVCQGCGEHQIAGKPWHDRPKCRCRKNPDFVATGYWHDRWPNRVNLRATATNPAPPASRSNIAGRANGVNGDQQSDQ